MTSKTKRAFRATTPIARESLEAHLDQLLDGAFAGPLSINRIAQMMGGTPKDYARLGNLPPAIEGRMLKQVIILLAATNAEVMIFTGHPLSISDTAFERIRVSFGGEALATPATSEGSRVTAYAPDLVSINPAKGIAHLIDIKRNLNSYDSPRLSHLKDRMFAAAFGLPALLVETGMQVTVSDVRVALLNIECRGQDVAQGIWSLDGLEQLIGVPGAASVITRMRTIFAQRVSVQFAAALQLLIEDAVRQRLGVHGKGEVRTADGAVEPQNDDGDDPAELIVGFARLPDDDGSS